MEGQFHTSVFKDANQVQKHLEPFRKEGKRVVTTNGCFDILHAGHVHYLYEAASQGDILVVGINSDATVQKLKGKERPIQKEQDRVSVMGALKMVDCTFIFEEDDPREFIKIIKPDIHVKGGDYSKDILERSIVEENGGKVVIVSFVENRSTSTIIENIKGKS